jgi:uncharacterized FAD-dependent dehydrogenase
MTLRIKDVEIPVSEIPADSLVFDAVLKKLGLTHQDVAHLNIRKKSLDARRKARIVYHYQVDVDLIEGTDDSSFLGEGVERVDAMPSANPVEGLELGNKSFRLPPVIIGSGPAGIFAALSMVEAGQKCIIVERGEPVEDRMRTVNKMRRSGEFTSESNYCFGEGGAGTFSDGKLTCGRNHPLVKYLFEQWVKFGAPKEILYDAHPHIGTDFLMRVALNMRNYLVERGVEFVFGRRFVDFETKASGSRYQVALDDGTKLETDHLVLAIGHSARDTYDMLLSRGLAMAPKPFAIGARFEHPQDDINRIQFGNCQLLPAAEYKLVAHAQDRGIWTFCMCPGGHLLPTNAQPGHLAINGMSYHARNSGYANAAVVVNVLREDFYKGHILDGVKFQEDIEKLAFKEGGGNYFSPAQRMQDFMAGRQSKGELKSTYKPGVTGARLDRVLPSFVVDALRFAIVEYNKKMRGYISPEAMVVGVETKTSSPIVMMRDKSLQSVSHPGFFPCGEGAGFAGGIVSAALDGVRIGRAVLEDAIDNQFLASVH